MWVLALLLPMVSAVCSPSSLGREFSECVKGQRTAYFYWKDGCTDPIPEPATGLDCTMVCEPGYYLDVDVISRKSTCSLCPGGTYSIGGGMRIAGSEGDWKSLNSTFSTYCYTSSYLEWETGTHCTPWASDQSGRYVMSGSATNLDEWLESDLITFVHLVRSGNLTARYKKGSKVFNNIRNGVFIIYVNGDRVYNDDSPVDNTWTTITLPLESGPSQIVISYEMYNTQGCESLRATVDFLEITGTDYSAHECFPCKVGYSNEGASGCAVCPLNFYLLTNSGVNSCGTCDEKKFAPAGSVGQNACVDRMPCTVHDYTASYTPCINGTTTYFYQWIEPSICDKSHLQLPADEVLPCPVCSPGMYHKPVAFGSSETDCEWCPDGSALTESAVGDQCVNCGAGFYAEKVLNYSAFSSIPRQMSTYCLVNREACKLSDGWIPIETAISTVRHM